MIETLRIPKTISPTTPNYNIVVWVYTQRRCLGPCGYVCPNKYFPAMPQRLQQSAISPASRFLYQTHSCQCCCKASTCRCRIRLLLKVTLTGKGFAYWCSKQLQAGSCQVMLGGGGWEAEGLFLYRRHCWISNGRYQSDSFCFPSLLKS